MTESDLLDFDGDSLIAYFTETSDIGDYEFYIVGTLGSFESATSNEFELEILDPCLTTELLPENIWDLTFNLFDEEPATRSFRAFETQVEDDFDYVCGETSYDLVMQDGTALPAFITLDASSRVISAYTETLSDYGDYDVKIVASNTYAEIADVEVELTVRIAPCPISYVQTPWVSDRLIFNPRSNTTPDTP